ncbi:MAG: TlpA family protein disulfide reductase [Ignavibacteria bacterium]|nr:TlpA family protein disulfide reductase [Ignavibacteria bacterium]
MSKVYFDLKAVNLVSAVNLVTAVNATLFIAVTFLLMSCAQQPTTSPGVGLNVNFTQTTPSGGSVSLTDYKGKVVMVEFWATWCSPCRAHTPYIKSFWESHRAEKFQIIGISLDYDLNAWRSYITDNDLSWAHGSDGMYWDNAVATQFNVRFTPAFVVFDTSGKQVSTVSGYNAAINLVDSLLAQ